MAGAILDIIPSGVAVVSSKSGDKINGMTAAWVAQVSFDPPMVVVSVAPERYTHELIEESKVFAISILDENQIELGKLFGTKSGKNVDKFADIPYETRRTGAPIINNTAAFVECKVVDSVTAGDHTVFVGEVVDSGVLSDNSPLIFRTTDFF